MSISLTPLAKTMIEGEVPREPLRKIPTLDQVAKDSPTGTWARTSRAINEAGHYLYQKVWVDPRSCLEWDLIASDDPSQNVTRAKYFICNRYGGSTWRAVDESIKAVQRGDNSIFRCIQVVENFCELDPTKTRLSVVDSDIVPWCVAALLDRSLQSWTGFSAVRHDRPRFDKSPSMCGLTVELARKLQ
jgi:hypothetical protein